MPARDPRAIVVVLDSVGCGELPDADAYGDGGSNTLGNVALAVGGLRLPNLARMGLGNVAPIEGVRPTREPAAWWGKAGERSEGKDTTTGHWEMMGIVLERGFPTYPNGFPPEVMAEFERRTGLGWLGNKPASGTAIIAELGSQHVSTGKPIVYTSADSVFQIAAHEAVIPVERLYQLCEIARGMLTGEHNVARVIARPFVGEPGAFVRTHRRRDFAVKPPAATALDVLQEAGVAVLGIGKIGDIFEWQGVTSSPHVTDNMDAWDKLLEAVGGAAPGFVFANLVDFDMLWGHRNDPAGYAAGLEAVDTRLPELLDAMVEGDLLVVTADHGCDPTTASTDHSREYVPVLATVAGAPLPGATLGVRETFADIGATVLDFYGLADKAPSGTSFLGELRG